MEKVRKIEEEKKEWEKNLEEWKAKGSNKWARAGWDKDYWEYCYGETAPMRQIPPIWRRKFGEKPPQVVWPHKEMNMTVDEYIEYLWDERVKKAMAEAQCEKKKVCGEATLVKNMEDCNIDENE